MDAETKIFKHEPNAKEQEAGIDIFNKFGDLNILESLSERKVWLWETIKGLPYEVVLAKRQMNIAQTEFETRYRELNTPKA